MNIAITINSTNRTSSVLVDSLRVNDRINQQVNEASFTTVGGYRPNVGEELTITDGGTTMFAGIIMRVTQVTRSLKTSYQVQCKDYTHYLDRQIVVERYENTTVAAIIENIIDTYTTGFTYNGVSAPQTVDSLAFNRIPVSECIERLAELTGFKWYVDYDKDIHFFELNTEVAPFSLSATNNNHVWDSLSVKEDISQLRNRIYILGGDVEGNSRTETYSADGDQLQFPLANKYASKPTVTKNAVAQTVGVDFLDDEDSFDCFWSFQEKYIRFKTAPTAGDEIAVSGIPLYPLVVNVGDPVSINEFGTYEFKIKDRAIVSRDQAIARAKVELEQYGQALEEGEFTTYQSGLKSGQVITIDANGIAGDYLIQSVVFTARTPTDGEWDVKIASLQTVNMIGFLQKLLRDDEITQDEAEVLINYYFFEESLTVTDSVGTPTTSSPPYVWGVDAGNELKWNLGTWT